MSSTRRHDPSHKNPSDVYPDMNPPESYTSSSLTNLLNTFTTPSFVDGRSETAREYTSKTLKEWLESVSPRLTMLTRMQIATADGWWSKFAPIQTVEKNQQIMIETWENVALEETPEEVPPSFLTWCSQTQTFSLKRFSLGTTFLADFQKVGEGKEKTMKAMSQIISACYITMNLAVTQAIYNSRARFTNGGSSVGKVYSDLMSATSYERSTFGILNRTSKGLYKLCAEVDAITEKESVTTDMVVFPSGTLNRIAGNHFESEPSRRGEQGYRNLSMGGKALKNSVIDKEIHEDIKMDIPNVSISAIDRLSALTRIGQYYVMDDKILDVIQPGTANVEKIMSIQIPSMKGNKWVTLGVRDMLDVCCRYEADGSLSSVIQDLAENIQTTQQKTGLDVSDGKVDPYLWRANTTDLSGDNYRPIKYWGDIEPHYWPNEKVIRNAMWAKHTIMQKLDQSDIQNINRLRDLKNSLALPPSISDDAVQAFVFAVTALNGYSPNSDYLNGTMEASVELPYRISIAPGEYRLNYIKNGATFVVHIGKGGARTGEFHSTLGETSAFAGIREGVDLAGVRERGDGNQADAWTPAPVVGRPFGYTSFNHLSYLSRLYQNSDYRGWDPEIFKIAYDGVKSLEKFMKIEKSIFGLGHNIFFDQNNIPIYMKTGNQEQDELTVAITSLWDNEVSYPLLSRIPVEKAYGYFLSVVTQTEEPDIPEGRAFTAEMLNQIYINLGFTNVNAAEAPTKTLNTYKSELRDILESREIDPSIRELIKNDSALSISENWKDGKFNLGNDFSKYIIATYPTATNINNFFFYYVHEISPIDEATRPPLLNAVFKLAVNGGVTRLTPKFKDSVIKSFTDRLMERGIIKGNASEGVATNARYQFINTRLIFSNKLWQMETRKIKDVGGFRKLLRSIIRPSDPLNAAIPLLDNIPVADSDPGEDELNDVIKEFDYSRASFNFQRSALGIFEHEGIIRSYVREERETKNLQAQGKTEIYNKKQKWRSDIVGGLINPFIDTYSQSNGEEVISDRIFLKGRLTVLDKELESDEILRITAQLMCTVEDNRQNQDNLLRNNVPIPMLNFALVSPFITLLMGYAIFAKSGAETAITGHNYESAILQLNGSTGRWILNFSVWIGVIIVDDTKFLIVPNVVFQEYISGYDTSFYDNADQFNSLNPDFSRSMFCFALGGNQNREDIPNPLTLQFKNSASQFPHRFTNQNAVMYNRPKICSALFYSRYWNFSDLNSNSGEERLNSKYIDDISSFKVNGICWTGPVQRWSHRDFDYKALELGTGHIGDVLPPKAFSMLNGAFLSEIPQSEWLA